MFYNNIPKEEIPKDIRQSYEYKFKPYRGQLVIVGHEVVELVDMLRDDKFDGEWCFRVLHFPNETTQCSDNSILLGPVIPLKGVIKPKHYKDLVHSWKINEERCPYNRNYRKEY